MNQVFLSFVGLHDPGEGGEDEKGIIKDGPLPSIVRHLLNIGKNVNKIVLFYSPPDLREGNEKQSDTETEYNATCERVVALIPNVKIVSVKLIKGTSGIPINPALEEDVLPVILEWLDKNPFTEADEVHVNYASGTGAMTRILTFLVDSRLIPNATLWNSLNPHKPHEPDKRVHTASVSYLDEARHVYTAVKLMQGMAFAEANDALASITREQVTSARVGKVQLWRLLLETYTLWDRAFYQEALRKSVEVRSDAFYDKLPSHIKIILDDQWVVLANVSNSRDHAKSLPILLDLYASLSRRLVTRHYPNIATRTRRIIDGCMRCAIGQDMNGTDVARKNSASRVMSLNAGTKIIKEEAEKHLRTYTTVALIERQETWGITPTTFGFRLFHLQAIWEIYTNISEHLNESIEIHGFKSPNDQPRGGKVKKMAEAAQSCLSLMCYGDRNHPLPEAKELAFGSGTISSLADAFRAWV